MSELAAKSSRKRCDGVGGQTPGYHGQVHVRLVRRDFTVRGEGRSHLISQRMGLHQYVNTDQGKTDTYMYIEPQTAD